MASQWVINNKKVKDWTIGGKKVKSITFPNGKVFEISEETTPQGQLITAQEYQTMSFSQGGVNPGGGAGGNVPDVLTIRKYDKDVNFELSKPLTLDMKIDATIATNDLEIIVNDINFGSQTFTFKTLTKPFTLHNSHRYKFENNKDPVDLGTY